jgi:asparagine synthase (glutamine-hydrolysing)
MCGYVAVFSKHPRQFAEGHFDAALAAIHHRGPDSRSSWFDPQGKVAFRLWRTRVIS